MKKFSIYAVFAVFLSCSVFAIEWGGRFLNDTTFNGNKFSELKVKQNNTVGLWLSVPFNNANTTYLAAESFYKFKYDASAEDASKKNIHTLDLNLLKFSTVFNVGQNKSIALNAGRFFILDSTYNVFAQTSDGVSLNYNASRLNLGAYAGFTGLLNSKSVTIITPENTKYLESENQLYTFAPKYIPLGLTLNIPQLFANQQLNVQVWEFIDANGDDFNRFYVSCGLDGFILKNLSYSVSSVLGSENFKTISNLSSISARYILMSNFMISANALYASGKNGKLSAFNAFSSGTADYSFAEPEYSGLMKLGGGASYFVADGIIFTDFAAVFNCPENSVNYKGFQYQLGINWNIFNDFQVGASIKQFFGNDSADDRTAISLKAAVML